MDCIWVGITLIAAGQAFSLYTFTSPEQKRDDGWNHEVKGKVDRLIVAIQSPEYGLKALEAKISRGLTPPSHKSQEG